MLTVDASIWVAAFEPLDHFHAPSVRFLATATGQGWRFCAPALMPLEVACAIARRAGKDGLGPAILDRLRGYPRLMLHPMDDQLLAEAARLGPANGLRAADALYAATAAIRKTPLITWDRELLECAGALTPTGWLEAAGR
ncbi:MAG: type II toxin-antitoxin system VapC family toxin [Anaerolineae bacterium]|nr:PIN domain-containing protein [Ardenticatenia bacterium]HQZ72019.1 PIN domain-containing protein [Anaerolineae bacterium]